MARCYKLNPAVFGEDPCKLSLLTPLGFSATPAEDGDYDMVKVERQAMDSEVVAAAMRDIYCNPAWRQRYYDSDVPFYTHALGLRYRADGRPAMTKRFVSVLCDWRLVISNPLDEGLLWVHSGDPLARSRYVDCANVDAIAGDTIRRMQEAGYLITADVDDSIDSDDDF